MVYQIAETIDEPRRLTQAVLQIVDMLGLYQAELARILRLKCGDIGRLAAAQQCLEAATPAWGQAQLLVRCYRALYVVHNGDGVAMRHWLRVSEASLGGVPHLLIVDDGRLADVVAWLEPRAWQTGQG
ncbi:MAG: hypothetical protein PVH38_04765 [Gammaproteobacteria bacterium]